MINIKETVALQLASEMGCSVSDILNSENIFICQKKAANSRVTMVGETHLICLNNKIIFRSNDQKLVDWMETYYEKKHNEWFSDFSNLKKLDMELQKYGQCIQNFHPFFVPRSKHVLLSEPPALTENLKTHWYKENELAQFKNDSRFQEALAFNQHAPDKLAVTIENKQTILGMAAASMDSVKMWQIGIDVLPEYRGHGLAAKLVTLLKDRLLELGIVPYYGTELSHTRSMQVAIAAGFTFAWSELAAKKF